MPQRSWPSRTTRRTIADWRRPLPLWTDFIDDPDAFMHEHMVLCPGAQADGGALDIAAEGTFYRAPMTPRVNRNMGYDVRAVQRDAWFYRIDAGLIELVLLGTGRAAAVGGGGLHRFPMYFLPWNRGCIARMKLPRGGLQAIFATAVMNGCAFLVFGSRAEPVVCHLNVASPDPLPGNWPLVRQTILETQIVRAKMGTPDRKDTQRILTKWGAVPGRHNAEANLIAAGPTYGLTALEEGDAADRLDALLRADFMKRNPGDNPLTDLKCFLFGLREAGEWRFFYQRVTYTSVVAIQRLGKTGGLIKLLNLDNRQAQAFARYTVVPGSEHVAFWP